MPRPPDVPSSTRPSYARGPQPEADREWLRAAVRRYERPLVAYATHLIGRLDAACDVVQETFVRLCGAAPDDVEPRLAQWLFTVTRNAAIDHRRKERRMSLIRDNIPANAAETFVTAVPPPDHAAEADDSLAAVLNAMAALPPVQQEVVRLKFQHGLSYKEIGAVMNLTVTNVGFLLHTALKTLRTQFNETPTLRLRA